MKTRILLGILITFFITCSKSPTDSSSVNYTLSDLVGRWIGTAKGYIGLDLNVDSEGKVSGSGVSSQWSIDNKGKVTGGGSFGFISGSHYIVANASWSLQLDSEKTSLSGECDASYPSLHNMTVNLTKTGSLYNTAPTASFTISPTSGTTTTIFTFDASGSTDNEDATIVLEVRWDWDNDGIYDTDFSMNKTTTHQYTSIGTYTVKLEVKDDGGLTNTTTKTVNISTANTAPIASFIIDPIMGTIATIFDFDASGCTDNEDATSTLQVRWDWENDGTYDTNYSTTKTSTHQYTAVGTYTVKLEVKDSRGSTNTTTKEVTVTYEDDISIKSVDPSTGLVPNASTDFEVVVEYSLASLNEAEIDVCFNDSEQINWFFPIDTKPVTKGSGENTFNVSVTAKDWGEEGDFKVAVHLYDSDHEILSSDEEVLLFK